MILALTLMLLTTVIPILFIILNIMMSKKTYINQEKSTPFECGFDPMSTSRLPLSIQFFMISMLFLIFDIEIILLIPLIPIIQAPSITMIILSIIFLIILFGGLYLEYLENSLEWKI